MIDYLADKNKATQRVNDLLAGRSTGIDNELANTQKNIEGSRNQNLDALSGTLQGIGSQYNLGAIPTDTSLIRRNLGSSLGMNLANQRFNLNSQNMSDMLGQKSNLVSDAQNVLGQHKNFASASANQNMAQQQQGKLADMQREQSMKIAQMGINQSNQMQDMSNQMNYPQGDYQSSLMRVLTGLPVQIGTAYALNKYGSMGQSQTPQVGMNPTQYTGYGPQQQNMGQYPMNPYSIQGYK